MRSVVHAIIMLFFSASSIGQQKAVCITVDDLPGTNDTAGAHSYVMSRLTNYFSSNDIPAIGFVNEYKLYSEDTLILYKVELLERWADNGLELGNHTFSHIFINQASLDEYKQDVIKGEKVTGRILREQEKQLHYFRHTQLRTGPTDEYRRELDEFLRSRGYQVAPVTIDNDEYIYAYCYTRADSETKKKIAEDYLNYMTSVCVYYERLAYEFLGYHIPQTLLIHANELNADYILELTDVFRNRGYQFISLEEALKDQVYMLPVGTHQRGPSWIHRWMLAKGQSPAPQPEVSEYISQLYNQLR